MPKFRKKPVIIDAMQFDRKNNAPLLQFVEELTCEPSVKRIGMNTRGQMYVKTLEGDMLISDKDWLIRGANGEFYPCKPDIFEKTYEVVKEEANAEEAHNSTEGKQYY